MTPPPDLPERRSLIEIDRVVGTAAKQPRHDRPPTRRGTLPGIPAQATLPGPPRTPLEYSPTARAPSTTSATLRAADETVSVPPAGSLPPLSQSPAEAVEAALRRELAAAKAANEAADTERKRLELELAAKALAAEQAAKTVSKDPEKIWGIPLRNAMIGFIAAVTALGAPATIWLTARAESAKQEAERQRIQTEHLQAQVSAAKVGAGQATKEAAVSKSDLIAQRVYYREVFRLMGVQLPKRDGDPDAAPDLKPYTAFCQAGKVCDGPQIIVTVPP